MRWFFLAFVLLVATVGNAAVFEELSLVRVIGGGAFNLFVVALLATWWHSYYLAGAKKARGLVIGHALIMLAAGLGFVGIGIDVSMTESCQSTVSASDSYRLRTKVSAYIQSLGYCRELGYGLILFGLFLAYPSIRLPRHNTLLRRSAFGAR